MRVFYAKILMLTFFALILAVLSVPTALYGTEKSSELPMQQRLVMPDIIYAVAGQRGESGKAPQSVRWHSSGSSWLQSARRQSLRIFEISFIRR